MQAWRGALTIRRLIVASAVSFVMFYPAAPVRADVADVELKDLVAHSDLIVVVTISKVEDGPKDIEVRGNRSSPVKVATAPVVETWKGEAVKDVRFVASPTWTCDISSAKEGEKRVLFLQRRPDSPIMSIVHWGRGGMLLHDVKDKPYAIVSEGVILPAGTKTISEKISAPSTWTYERRSIEFETLRALVRQMSR
jgi:hypothetical protein